MRCHRGRGSRWGAVLASALAAAPVAAVPSVPPPASANAVALQRRLDAAVAGGTPALTIEPGTYVFSNTSAVISGAVSV